MIKLNYRLRKGTEGYKFNKPQEKFNTIIYMGDIKLFA